MLQALPARSQHRSSLVQLGPLRTLLVLLASMRRHLCLQVWERSQTPLQVSSAPLRMISLVLHRAPSRTRRHRQRAKLHRLLPQVAILLLEVGPRLRFQLRLLHKRQVPSHMTLFLARKVNQFQRQPVQQYLPTTAQEILAMLRLKLRRHRRLTAIVVNQRQALRIQYLFP